MADNCGVVYALKMSENESYLKIKELADYLSEQPEGNNSINYIINELDPERKLRGGDGRNIITGVQEYEGWCYLHLECAWYYDDWFIDYCNANGIPFSFVQTSYQSDGGFILYDPHGLFEKNGVHIDICLAGIDLEDDYLCDTYADSYTAYSAIKNWCAPALKDGKIKDFGDLDEFLEYFEDELIDINEDNFCNVNFYEDITNSAVDIASA